MARLRLANPAFLLIICCPLYAQEPPSSNAADVAALAQQVQALQQETQELRERIRNLEANQAPAAPAPSASMPQNAQPSPAPAEQTSDRLPAKFDEPRGIEWRGFGEADYKVLNQRKPELGSYGFVPGSSGNFYSGDFDLFLHAQMNSKSSVLADLAFEETDAQNYKLDPRQILLKYDLNDHLRMSFGRFQTGVGYYNWAFRSAAWLQTTADRPLVMEYASNGGILPTQAIGVSTTGSIPSGTIGLHYMAEYGSSDTMRPDLTGDGIINDENNGNFLNLGLYIEPDATPGLRIGGSFYHDRISDLLVFTNPTVPPPSDTPSPNARFNQSIMNAHVVYVSAGIEFLNEAFLIRHSLVGGNRSMDTTAFYSQISKKFGRIRPFVRYQYANASERNPIYDDLGLRDGPSFGAGYDINSFITFKAQLDHTRRRNLPDLNGLHLQAAFVF